MLLEHFEDRGAKIFARQGFVHQHIRPDQLGFFLGVLVGMCGQQNDRCGFEARNAFDPRADFKSVNKGHGDVENNQIWGVVFEVRQSFSSVGNLGDLVQFGGQNHLEQAADAVGIIGDEDFFGFDHWVSLIYSLMSGLKPGNEAYTLNSNLFMSEINPSLQLNDPPEATRLLVLEISIAGQTYAIRAESVQKVLPLAAWTAQAGLPEHVVGVLQIEDQILPVVNARVYLGFETRLPQIEDHLVLVETNSRFLIWLDRVNALRDWHETDTLLNLQIFEPAVNP